VVLGFTCMATKKLLRKYFLCTKKKAAMNITTHNRLNAVSFIWSMAV
jgi:hypothetical protein